MSGIDGFNYDYYYYSNGTRYCNDGDTFTMNPVWESSFDSYRELNEQMFPYDESCDTFQHESEDDTTTGGCEHGQGVHDSQGCYQDGQVGNEGQGTVPGSDDGSGSEIDEKQEITNKLLNLKFMSGFSFEVDGKTYTDISELITSDVLENATTDSLEALYAQLGSQSTTSQGYITSLDGSAINALTQTVEQAQTREAAISYIEEQRANGNTAPELNDYLDSLKSDDLKGKDLDTYISELEEFYGFVNPAKKKDEAGSGDPVGEQNPESETTIDDAQARDIAIQLYSATAGRWGGTDNAKVDEIFSRELTDADWVAIMKAYKTAYPNSDLITDINKEWWISDKADRTAKLTNILVNATADNYTDEELDSNTSAEKIYTYKNSTFEQYKVISELNNLSGDELMKAIQAYNKRFGGDLIAELTESSQYDQYGTYFLTLQHIREEALKVEQQQP